MARLPSNDPLSQLSGHIGKKVVVKQYANKTIVTAYPNMSNIKPSKKQKQNAACLKKQWRMRKTLTAILY